MSRYRGTPEGAVLASVLDYLAAERIWHRRMNTGAVGTDERFFRFGSKGMADILASPRIDFDGKRICGLLWIECKAPGGKQSSAQKDFQAEVTEAGHDYLLAYSIDDVKQWLEVNR